MLTASRTHRERKEQYIRALEHEVARLKEMSDEMTRDKDRLAEENVQLKQLLAQHGIAWTGTGGVAEFQSHGGLAGASLPRGGISYIPAANLASHPNAFSEAYPVQQPPALDLKSAGIDFVLTYGNPYGPYLALPHD